jgi:hypothetical protein
MIQITFVSITVRIIVLDSRITLTHGLSRCIQHRGASILRATTQASLRQWLLVAHIVRALSSAPGSLLRLEFQRWNMSKRRREGGRWGEKLYIQFYTLAVSLSALERILIHPGVEARNHDYGSRVAVKFVI